MFFSSFDLNKFMGFEKQPMTSAEESSSMETTNFLANMSTFIFIGVIIVCCTILGIILAIVCAGTIKKFLIGKLITFRN